MNIRELEEALNDGADIDVFRSGGGDAYFIIYHDGYEFVVKFEHFLLLSDAPGGGVFSTEVTVESDEGERTETVTFRFYNIDQMIRELASPVTDIISGMSMENAEYGDVIDQINEQFLDMDFEITYEYGGLGEIE